MVETPSLLAFALAGTCLALLGSVLAGLWLGFRIASRDAATLAVTQRVADSALEGAQAAHRRADALEEAWEAQVQRVERKRASAAAAASRAEAATKDEEAPAPEPLPLEGRDRRRAIARSVNAGRIA